MAQDKKNESLKQRCFRHNCNHLLEEQLSNRHQLKWLQRGDRYVLACDIMTNLVSCLLDYEAGKYLPKRPVLKRDRFALPEIIKCNPDGHQTDPIAVKFSSHMFDQRLLAMADYDGYISMVNTSEVLPDCINVIEEPDQNVKAQWVAHHNAINDLHFIKGDRQLLTAATDFNVRQWDTMTAVCIATMAGHSASVKCLSVHPVCSDVVASGGKDGSIMLWDLRVPSRATEQFPVRGAQVHVEVAHRPRSGTGIFSQGTNVSITSLQFLKHSGLLASASDTSSTVKLWDIRMADDPVAFLPAEMPPDATLPAPHLNMVPLSNHLDYKSSSGLCHLCTDPDGLWLSVMRRDGCIHMYDALRADCSVQPSRGFRVDEPLTLRSTTALSPDGQWLAATSAYGSTFIFNVNDMDAAPIKLHAGEASQWQRRNYDAAGNTGIIGTATRKDAEVTGVCWGKEGTGELAICRTAQQLQIWRSDYVNHELGMRPSSVADRSRWPAFIDIAPKPSVCDAIATSSVLPGSAELAAPTAQPSVVPVQRAAATEPPRTSTQASASVGRNTSGGASTFITPASTVAGQPDRSSQPADADAAQSAPVSPSEPCAPLQDGAPADLAGAATLGGSGPVAAPVAPASGGTTPQPRHSSGGRAPGAALSAALLQPPPNTGPSQGPISAGAGSGNHAQAQATPAARMPADAGANVTPPLADTTPTLQRRGDAQDRSGHNSESEACEGADTDGSALPSRQEELERAMSTSARPSQHGLNNTFVEIAQSPQRLSRPARSLGQGLSPNVHASPSVQPGPSPAAQRDGDPLLRSAVAGSPSSMPPPLRAPLAALSSADLVRSPSALMRGGPAVTLARGAAGTLSPIDELAAAAAGGREMVPDTQSIDGSPLCPTVAPVPTQCSQARQRIASQALAKKGSRSAAHLQATVAASSPQPARRIRGAPRSAGRDGQGTPDSTQHLADKGACAASQQQCSVGAGPSGVLPVARAGRSRSRSHEAVSQEFVGSQARTARKRSSCEMTADASLHSLGEHGKSAGQENPRQSKQPKRSSCVVTPDSADNATHPKFRPPICDSQPKEVFAIVSSKKRRITATCVQSSSRAKTAFRMAGTCDPDAIDKDNWMAGRSAGGGSRERIATENDAQMLNIAAQQACCSQDSHSVVPSHSQKMAVSESLKALGKRTQGKAGAKGKAGAAAKPANEAREAPGSQPSIMKFFRRD